MSNKIITSVSALTDDNIDNITENNIVCIDLEQGFIGVHTSNPVYEIDVSGTIKCSSLKIGDVDILTITSFINIESLPLDVIPNANNFYNIGNTSRIWRKAHIGIVDANTINCSTVNTTTVNASNIISETILPLLNTNNIGAGGNILPSSNIIYDLGSIENKWKHIYTNNINTLTINGLPYSGIGGSGGTSLDLRNITGDIIPFLNNDIKLGDVSKYWNNAYINHVIANTMTSKNIAALPISVNYWELMGSSIVGTASNNRSGYSISLNATGDIVAISDSSYNNNGRVIVYRYTPQSSDVYMWEPMGQVITSDLEVDIEIIGQSVSLNAAGTILAIGATYKSNSIFNGTIPDNYKGYVRVYEFSGNYWQKIGDAIEGTNVRDEAGWSVSLSADGTRVAFSSINYNNYAGYVSVYQYYTSASDPSWVQLGININGEAQDDRFGYSISLNAQGNRVAIGAPFNDGSDSFTSINKGHVRVYQYRTSPDISWIPMGTSIYGDVSDDKSGWSVSLNTSGTIVAIGTPYNDGNGTNSGHVRVFQYNDSASDPSWIQMGTPIAGEAANDLFGYSVSLNAAGTILAIGAPSNDGRGSNSGHVRVYQYRTSPDISWIPVSVDIDGEAIGDESGYCVSLNAAGTRLAIGAPFNDGRGSNSGHVRVYQHDNTRSLGTAGDRWKNVYVDDLSVNTINGLPYGGSGGSSNIVLTSVSGDIIPYTNNTYKLGDFTRNWSNCFFSSHFVSI